MSNSDKPNMAERLYYALSQKSALAFHKGVRITLVMHCCCKFSDFERHRFAIALQTRGRGAEEKMSEGFKT